MPFKPTERLYRNFAATNFKQVESAPQGDSPAERSFVVRGYFCTFNDPYPLFDDFYETIDRNAFDECDFSDVVMQVNHEGFVYARTRNGSLRLGFDDHGGYCEADLSGTKQGREDLYEAITNGLIDRMSFGFTIADDGFEWREDQNGFIHTRITKIRKLFDVAAIAGHPANEGTDISARSYVDAAIEAQKKAEERAAQEAEETPEEPIETFEEPATEEPADEPVEEPALTEEELIEETFNRRSRLKRRARALSLKTIYIQQ